MGIYCYKPHLQTVHVLQKPDDWTWQRRSMLHGKTILEVYLFPDLSKNAQHVGKFVKPS